jgi:hypothetical protein
MKRSLTIALIVALVVLAAFGAQILWGDSADQIIWGT